MYEIKMTVKDEHIDFQGIMDGLFYPFYFEECRHNFLKDACGVDIQEFAKNGFNLVLSEYTLKFRSSLKQNDEIVVTSELEAIEKSRTTFAINQSMLRDGKVVSSARFLVTCVPASGGRPFIPEEIKQAL